MQENARADWGQRIDDTRLVLTAGDLLVSDMDSPFHYEFTTHCASTRIQIPLQLLGVGRDALRRIPPVPVGAPLYGLLVDYLLALSRDADRMVKPVVGFDVGLVTLDLVRAFLVTAQDPDSHDSREALSVTLLSRVREYVRRHLCDCNLTVASIARAHNISERYLYKVCAESHISLEQFIITERLRGARLDLAASDAGRRTIAQVSASWGFRNPRHFSRRFTEAFGVTPGEWRRIVSNGDTSEGP